MTQIADNNSDLDCQSTEKHCGYLHEALKVAQNCQDVEWYGVGCVIVNAEGIIIGTGYTGEIIEEGKMRHAEDVAIAKAIASGQKLAEPGIVLYSTLEPCSIRASGKTPCCHHIIDSGIKAVVYGAKEPFDANLGIVCEGDSVLTKAGVHVTFLSELESLCLTSVVSKRRSS